MQLIVDVFDAIWRMFDATKNSLFLNDEILYRWIISLFIFQKEKKNLHENAFCSLEKCKMGEYILP